MFTSNIDVWCFHLSNWHKLSRLFCALYFNIWNPIVLIYIFFQFDEVIPDELDTQHGGFYINFGDLLFKKVEHSERFVGWYFIHLFLTSNYELFHSLKYLLMYFPTLDTIVNKFRPWWAVIYWRNNCKYVLGNACRYIAKVRTSALEIYFVHYTICAHQHFLIVFFHRVCHLKVRWLNRFIFM